MRGLEPTLLVPRLRRLRDVKKASYKDENAEKKLRGPEGSPEGGTEKGPEGGGEGPEGGSRFCLHLAG